MIADPLFRPILWAVALFPLLYLCQRWINRHLYGLSLLLTGSQQWSVIAYALVLYPGVVLHELSHWLTAGALGVRTGRVSLIPRRKEDGSIQFGYVEFYRDGVGPFRESLIGAAPLLFGIGAIVLIGTFVFDVQALQATLQSSDATALLSSLEQLLSKNDFFVWLYLLFAISNGMMPSRSDRRAWPIVGGVIIVIAALLFGLGPRATIAQSLGELLATPASYLATAFGLTIAVDLLFGLVIIVLETLFSRIRKQKIQYQ